jgi:hypothetical protein
MSTSLIAVIVLASSVFAYKKATPLGLSYATQAQEYVAFSALAVGGVCLLALGKVAAVAVGI